MKTTKKLNTTKTPIDIKRRLDLALRRLAETTALLESLDETSFPPGYLHKAASHTVSALAAVVQLDTHRPLKKTERPAAEPSPTQAPAPEGEVFFVLEDGRIEVAPTAAPEEVAPAAAAAETDPTEPTDAAAARRARKRERDRASAARRRAAKAA